MKKALDWKKVYQVGDVMKKRARGTKRTIVNGGIGGTMQQDGYYHRTYKRSGEYTWTLVSESFEPLNW